MSSKSAFTREEKIPFMLTSQFPSITPLVKTQQRVPLRVPTLKSRDEITMLVFSI